MWHAWGSRSSAFDGSGRRWTPATRSPSRFSSGRGSGGRSAWPGTSPSGAFRQTRSSMRSAGTESRGPRSPRRNAHPALVDRSPSSVHHDVAHASPDQPPECQIVVRAHQRIPAVPLARAHRRADRDLVQSSGKRIEHRVRRGRWVCAPVWRPRRGLSRGTVSPDVSISYQLRKFGPGSSASLLSTVRATRTGTCGTGRWWFANNPTGQRKPETLHPLTGESNSRRIRSRPQQSGPEASMDYETRKLLCNTDSAVWCINLNLITY